MNWILLSFIALTCFSVMVTLITYTVRKGTPLSLVLFGIFAVGAIAYFFQVYSGPKLGSIPPVIIALLVTMGLLSFIGNWAQFQASTTAPNAGLAIGIVSLQAALIAIFALIFFKDKINSLQTVGIIVAIIGAIMIGLGSNSHTQDKTPNKNITATNQ